METLLLVAIIITGLAVVVQAGVLIAMYLVAKEVTANVDGLVSESKRMLEPLEHVTQNAQAASEDVAVIGKVVRDEMNHVSVMVEESHIALTQMSAKLSGKLSETLDEIQSRVVAPFRNWSALASAIGAGLQVLFKRNPERDDRRTPAA